MDEPAALAKEIRLSFRRRLILAGIALLFVPLMILGGIHRNTLDQGGDVREVPGRVVAIEDLRGSGARLVTEFTTHAGVVRRTDDSADWYPEAKVGDTLPVIYSAEPGSDFARLAQPLMDRLFFWTFYGAAGVFAAMGLASIAVGFVQRGRRLALAAHGVRIEGQRADVQQRAVPFVQGQHQWRVRASWLDEATVTWREVASEWQPGDPPGHVLRTEPAILVDPANARRAWLPNALLRF